MFRDSACDVLVVGAGPVGLMTGLTLARRGVAVRVVDQHRRTGQHGYALTLHPETLGLLAGAGCDTELLPRGQRVERIGFYRNEQERIEISLSRLDGPFPFALVVPQSRVEHALEQALARELVEVQWDHRVQQLESTGHRAGVELARLQDVPCGYPIARTERMVAATRRLQASFVVGADGFHSFVREHTGIACRQVGTADYYSVYEAESSTEPDDEIRIVLSDSTTTALLPLGNGRWRWVFQIEGPDQHSPTAESLNGWIASRAPWLPRPSGAPSWCSMVRFERRMAEQFGRDQFWLAGDAAHLTGPIGTQSMNAGVWEGWDLAGRLADVLGQASSGILEVYALDRREEWRRLLNLDNTLSVTSAAEPWIGEAATRVLSCIPAGGEDLEQLIKQLGLEFQVHA